MSYTITRDAFNAWHATNADMLRTNDYIQFDPDPEVHDDAFNELLSFLTSCTPLFTMMMIDNGLHVGPDDVTFDSDKLEAIENVADLVYADYENENDRDTDTPDSPWVTYKLSGDDDVDYCGSYINSAAMLLRLFTGMPFDNLPHIPA